MQSRVNTPESEITSDYKGQDKVKITFTCFPKLGTKIMFLFTSNFINCGAQTQGAVFCTGEIGGAAEIETDMGGDFTGTEKVGPSLTASISKALTLSNWVSCS